MYVNKYNICVCVFVCECVCVCVCVCICMYIYYMRIIQTLQMYPSEVKYTLFVTNLVLERYLKSNTCTFTVTL